MYPVVQPLSSRANRWRFAAAASLVGLAVLGGTVPAAAQAVAETLPSTMARVADLLEEGSSEDARLLLERLVETRPRYGPARLELGRLALERGSGQEALEHLGVAVRLPIRRAFLAWHLLGRAQLMVGRTVEAAHSFDEAISRADRFGPAFVGRAGAAFLLGRLEVAEANARRAVALAEAPGLAEALLAAILADQGREPEAGAVLSEFEDPWRTLESFRRLLEWLPLEPRVELLAARWSAELGATEAAECLAQRAIESAEPDARLLETVARMQLANGRAEDAIASIRSAIEMGREEPETIALLGRAELGLMRIEEAVSAFRRALERQPSLVDQIPGTGLTALAETLGDGVLPSLAAHVEAHSGCSAGLYLLGMSAKRDGDLEAALRWFERLAQLDEAAGTRYVLAQLYRRLGDEERGQGEMERFRELEMREEAEWLRQNEAFQRRLEAEGRTETEPLEALRIYRELAAEDLASAEDYVAAGRILAARGLREDARQWFERVLDREPFRNDALEGLARTFSGEPASAASRTVQERLAVRKWACAGGDPATR